MTQEWSWYNNKVGRNYEDQKAYTEQTIKDDKQIMLDRIQYLQGQRDKYVEDAINELKSK